MTLDYTSWIWFGTGPVQNEVPKLLTFSEWNEEQVLVSITEE